MTDAVKGCHLTLSRASHACPAGYPELRGTRDKQPSSAGFDDRGISARPNWAALSVTVTNRRARRMRSGQRRVRGPRPLRAGASAPPARTWRLSWSTRCRDQFSCLASARFDASGWLTSISASAVSRAAVTLYATRSLEQAEERGLCAGPVPRGAAGVGVIEGKKQGSSQGEFILRMSGIAAGPAVVLAAVLPRVY